MTRSRPILWKHLEKTNPMFASLGKRDLRMPIVNQLPRRSMSRHQLQLPTSAYHLSCLLSFTLLSLTLCACAGSSAFKKGKKLEQLKNYDEALLSYQQALEKQPRNHEYRLYFERARFQAAIAHFDQGRRLREVSKLEEALAEFQKASSIDPSNDLAAQEVRSVQKMIEERRRSQEEEKNRLGDLIDKSKVTGAREALSPIHNVPVTLKLTSDLRRAYEAIAKIAGINVIFEADLGNRLQAQVPVDLNSVTVLEALNILALQTKTYWSVINQNTILVANDTQTTRQLYEEQVIKTLYVGNSLATADLTEVLTMLRTLLDLRKVAPINAQNAIVIRDTPAKIAAAEKILQTVDKAKPEVHIDVAVLEVDRRFARNLGIVPPTAVGATNPPGGTIIFPPSPGPPVSIKDIDRIGSGNFYITLPTASLNISRTNAKVLQNPSLRASDGKIAKLRIGTKQPVAQGSFLPTFAGNVGGTPVTQFTTIDVGVNLDLTPRVLLNRDVSMNIKVSVNAITGFENFGGNRYPVLTNREVEHDIRLKEGESSVIGGIIQDTDQVDIVGIPGVEKIPLLRYLFSHETRTRTESEIIVVITPRVVRLPDYMDDDFEAIALLGSGTNPRFVGRPIELLGESPILGRPTQAVPSTPTAPSPPASSRASQALPGVDTQPAPRLAFVKLNPASTEVPVGSRVAVTVSIENAQNAYALSLNVAFGPKILKLVDVQNGQFLSSDGKIIAMAQRVENESGQAVISMTRPPDSAPVSGTGILINLVFETLSPGTSTISFTQGSNIRDASQAALPTSFSSTTVTVK